MKNPRRPGPISPSRTRSTDGGVSLLDRLHEQDLESVQQGNVLDFPTSRTPHRVRNAVLWTFAVLLVLLGLTAYTIFSPALALRNIQVEGNDLVTAADVETALEPLEGTPLTQISEEQVRELLADKAPIADVDIAAEPPSTLVVVLTERVPVAVLQNGSEFVLIDAEGRQLADVAEREDVRLPLISGGTEAVNTAVFSSITAVLAELPPAVLSTLNSASASSVDSIQLSLTGGQRIFWGSSERNALKAEVVEVLLAMPASEPPIQEFDVSTPDRPVTR